MNRTAFMHYTAPPTVGGVEAVMAAHARQFTVDRQPVSLIAGRGDVSALPEGCDLILIPEIDSSHPEVLKASESLELGIVPFDFEDLVNRLADKLRPVVSRFDHLIVHNVFTKHFNLPLTAALFKLMDEGTARGVIAWCHDLSWSSPSSRSKVHEGYPWNFLLTPRADMRYVAISQQRKREVLETFHLPPERVRVIYNGINPDLLLGISSEGRALADRLKLKDADMLLLMPVRITRAKNIEYAMELLVELKHSGINPRLVVTGPPDPHDPASKAYFQDLLDLRRQLNLEQELRFVYESGPKPEEPYCIDQQLVAELLRLSDLMFMPSHHEGFGLPVLEAGLTGIPVVTTAVPAALEITFEHVFIFSINTAPDMLVKQLLNWMEENSQFELRRKIKQEFPWEIIYQRDIKPLLEDPN